MGIDDFLKGFGVSAESVDRIRLGRGVVGKTTYAVIIVLIVLGIALTRTSVPWLVLVLAGMAALLFIMYFVGVIRFAGRNPGAALLEGAELLRWKQFDLAAKNIPVIPDTPPLVDPSKPLPALPPGSLTEPDQQ